MTGKPSADRMALFMAKVSREEGSDCWIWTGHVSKVSGYGQFWDGSKVVGAHVFSFVNHKGPLPPKHEPHHKCKVRNCVNPDHLEAVTRRQNLMLSDTLVARKAAQTHCIHGHEFSSDNTYQKKNGTRACRQCRADKNKAWATANRDRRRGIDRASYRKRAHKKEMQKQ